MPNFIISMTIISVVLQGNARVFILNYFKLFMGKLSYFALEFQFAVGCAELQYKHSAPFFSVHYSYPHHNGMIFNYLKMDSSARHD